MLNPSFVLTSSSHDSAESLVVPQNVLKHMDMDASTDEVLQLNVDAPHGFLDDPLGGLCQGLQALLITCR